MPALSKKMTSRDAGSSTKKNKKRDEDPAGDNSWTVVTAASSSRDSPQQPQDPLQTAVLYESVKKQQQQAGGCGHTVPLDRFVVRHKASCPVCDAPVYYVQDCGASLSSRTVCFKYGKIVYRLSVPHKEDSQQNNQQQRPWWMFWGGGGGHDDDGNTKNTPPPSSSETAATTTTTTAQGRIMSVLGMAHGGMKILCKGKVLYPLPSYTTEADREFQEQELSQKLIELSSSSSPANTSTAALLLVVGTPSQTQHDWLENEERERQRQQLRERTTEQPKDLWTVVTTATVQDVVRWGKYIVLYSFHFTAGVVWGCWDLVRRKLFGGDDRSNDTNEHSD